jgi:PadR family transcriptional regulator, regulatory protein AphA
MEFSVVEKGEEKYIECLPGTGLIAKENDALDIVAACGEHRILRVMIHAENLSDDFFKLRTGLAGAVLQKLVNYHIRAAAVLTPEQVDQGKFKDMVIETNRGNQFRVFYEREKAEEWLVH